MKRFLAEIAAVIAFAASLVVLSAQTRQTPETPSSRTVAAQQPNDMQAQEAKPFSGTIVKEKGQLVLKDSASNMSYQLDDQEKAKQFEGKQVKVTGKLDGKVIHVENIEAGSWPCGCSLQVTRAAFVARGGLPLRPPRWFWMV